MISNRDMDWDMDMSMYNMEMNPMSLEEFQKEPIPLGLITVLVCCILCLCSSGSSFYALKREVDNLKGDKSEACNQFTVFPVEPKLKVCPYGRQSACTKYEENDFTGYKMLLCPFNFALIGDDPPGSRSKILNLIASGYNTEKDIFNDAYYLDRDLRTPKSLTCSINMESCEDIGSNDLRYINIRSGDLIKLSWSDEEKVTERNSVGDVIKKEKYVDFYAYIIYDIIVTFTVGVGLADLDADEEDDGENMPIYINNVTDLKKAFANMESYFRQSFKTAKTLNSKGDPGYDFKCDNLKREIRVPKTSKGQTIAQKYSLICFFYQLEDLGALVKLFQNTFVKMIDRTIWAEYLAELKVKVQQATTKMASIRSSITMFEFIMYITLLNYLEDKNLKFIFERRQYDKVKK